MAAEGSVKASGRAALRPSALLLTLATAALLVACSAAAPPSTAVAVAVQAIAPPQVNEASAPPLETEAPSADAAPARRICIDPGHDAYWAVGASGRTGGGTVPRHPTEAIPLFEHDLTLAVAYRLKALLEADGVDVCVTRRPREEGGGLQSEPYDFSGDGRVRTIGRAIEDTPEVIQPRIDWANAFGAEALLSIHFNGSEDRRLRGTEVYYSDAGPRAADGRRLAESLLAGLLAELGGSGFAVTDRGVKSDRYQRYSEADTRRLLANNAATIRANGHDPAACPDCYRLVTTGDNPMSLHRGEFVGAVVEVEFLSNPDVVEGLLLRADAFDVIAAGLARGLRSYFEPR